MTPARILSLTLAEPGWRLAWPAEEGGSIRYDVIAAWAVTVDGEEHHGVKPLIPDGERLVLSEQICGDEEDTFPLIVPPGHKAVQARHGLELHEVDA